MKLALFALLAATLHADTFVSQAGGQNSLGVNVCVDRHPAWAEPFGCWVSAYDTGYLGTIQPNDTTDPWVTFYQHFTTTGLASVIIDVLADDAAGVRFDSVELLAPVHAGLTIPQHLEFFVGPGDHETDFLLYQRGLGPTALAFKVQVAEVTATPEPRWAILPSLLALFVMGAVIRRETR